MAYLSNIGDNERLIDLVHHQCTLSPERIAMKTTSYALSYKELWDKVSEWKTVITTALSTQLASKKEVIGLHLPNSMGYIISLLSVIGCGCSFLPLPVDLLKERLLFLLNDAAISKVIKLNDEDDLSSGAVVLLKHTIVGQDVAIVDLNKLNNGRLKNDLATTTSDNFKLKSNERSEDFLYLIYTSGSTGKPKGVKVKESSVINVTRAQIKTWYISPKDVIAQFASIGFDASIVEIFTAFLSGASVASLGENERLGETFIDAMNKMKVTIVTLPPSALNVYQPKEFQSLQKVISAGEVCNSNIARKWTTKSDIRFFNAYGPTEGTVCATSYEYIPGDASADNFEDLPIGKAIDGVEIYLLDDTLKRVQTGVFGEIYIGGKGVAYGYIGHAQYLNVRRFIKNPIMDESGILFKTGDYAVEDEDGNIYFEGRCDDQVKIRGHRIDLKEIEDAINKHQDIGMAVVVVHRCSVMKDNFLAAYIMSATIDINKLRDYLSKLLPKYMIPTFFKMLKASDIPKTINCKIDRKLLEVDESVHEQSRSSNANILTEEEFTVGKLWAKVFKFEESAFSYLSGDTSFLELGGDSLQLVRLQRLVEENINQTVPFAEIAKAETLNDFAKLIRQYKKTNTDMHDTNETDPLRRLIIRDSILENDIIPKVKVARCPTPNGIHTKCSIDSRNIKQSRNILLSGVTGFLGTFILSELLEQTSDHVFCMVRATCKVKGLSRIMHALKKFNLWRSEYMSRISVIVSDLTQEKFGIAKDVYSMLENKIDAVFMNGAEVNMNLPYEELRSANVESMKEAIKLAVSGSSKYLFATSSLSVFLFPHRDSGEINSHRRVCTEHEFLDDPLSIIGGYGQTKWVMERLVMQALDALPGGAIFRPARITGRSTDGAGPNSDLFSSILVGMKKFG